MALVNLPAWLITHFPFNPKFQTVFKSLILLHSESESTDLEAKTLPSVNSVTSSVKTFVIAIAFEKLLKFLAV